jgi:tetratricopeptide (TPR) repeat protein
MKKISIAIIAILAVFMAAIYSHAGEKEWQAVTDQAITYYQAGRPKEAIAAARKALKMGEEIFGPEDLKMVGSIDDLASYLKSEGRYVEAEALYKRALTILEKKLPPNDRYLAIFLNYLANFYDKIKKPDEATALRARAKAIRSMANKKEESAE